MYARHCTGFVYNDDTGGHADRRSDDDDPGPMPWSPSRPIVVYEVEGLDPTQFVAVEMNVNDICADGNEIVVDYFLSSRDENRTQPYPCDFVVGRCVP